MRTRIPAMGSWGAEIDEMALCTRCKATHGRECGLHQHDAFWLSNQVAHVVVRHFLYHGGYDTRETCRRL